MPIISSILSARPVRALRTLAIIIGLSGFVGAGCAYLRTTPNTELAANYGLARLSLDGQWKFKPDVTGIGYPQHANYDDTRWDVITVPSNWYLQGHEMSGKAWYRTRFKLPPAFANRHVRLAFEGADYAVQVWLNGVLLGSHEGSFQPFAFDATSHLDAQNENVLVVRVDSPQETDDAWSLNKRLIKGIFAHHDTRPGGAWSTRGQERNTGGIWGKVSLLASNGGALENITVVPEVNVQKASGAAKVRLSVRLDGSVPRHAAIRLRLIPENFLHAASTPTETHRRLMPGLNRLELNLFEPDAKLWWPVGRGQPNLYRLEASVSLGDEVLDKGNATFGFRVVDRDSATGHWRINGERLFLRGTNYIAAHWLSEMTPRAYARDIALMKSANVNVVRVHAHLEATSFYLEADRAGLLVWQDFPLQWGYEDSAEFEADAVRQAGDMVRMLYNHPSVIAWSMHNEPPFDASWMKYKYSEYDPEQNQQLNKVLFHAVSAQDQTRYVHAYSATDEHPWFGWYSGSMSDYAKPTEHNIISEFGAQALPEMASLKKIFTPEDLWPTTDEQWERWSYHNFQPRETFEIAKVEKGESTAQLIENTQRYQEKLTRLAAESYRRQRYKPVAAIFQFMFVEAWPSINWGVLDYWRVPKPGYFALRKAYQPVLPSIEWKRDVYATGEPVTLGFWIINDTLQHHASATLLLTVRRAAEVIEKRSMSFEVRPDEGRKAFAWEPGALPAGQYRVDVALKTSAGRILGTNDFHFEVQDDNQIPN